MERNRPGNNRTLIVSIVSLIVITFALAALCLEVAGKYRRYNLQLISTDAEKQALAVQSYLDKYATMAHAYANNPMLVQWFKQHQKRGADLSQDESFQRVNQTFLNLSTADDNIVSAYFASNNTGEYFRENEITGTVGESEYDATKRPWYIASVKSAQQTISNPVSDFSRSRLTVVTEEPIYDPQKQLVGVAGLDINLAAVKTMVDDLTKQGRGLAFLLDENAKVVHFNPKAAGYEAVRITTDALDSDGKPQTDEQGRKQKITTQIGALNPIADLDTGLDTQGFAAWAQALKNNDRGLTEVSFMGKRQVIAFAPVKLDKPHVHWTAAIMVPVDALNDPIGDLELKALVLLGLIIGLAFWARSTLRA